MNLTVDKRKYIGIQHILDDVQTVSPYGHKKLSQLQFFGVAEREQLIDQLDIMEFVVKNLCQIRPLVNEITHCLSRLKYITPSLLRLDRAILSDTELFEIKGFLIICEQIMPSYQQLNDFLSHRLPSLCNLSDALDQIDDGQRREYFAVPDNATAKLEKIRSQKRKIGGQLGGEKDEKLLEEFNHLCAMEGEQEEAYRGDLCQRLLPYVPQMLQNTQTFAFVDLLIAKCFLAVKTGAVRPNICLQLEAKNMTNPYILAQNHQLRSHASLPFTPLSISMPCGVTVITGANMGGKSVAVQTLTLNVALANMGFFVYADSFDTPVFDYIDFICAECETNTQGLSSFGAEVVRLNHAYCQAQEKKCFLVFDEFAKTTNASEGARLFCAVVESFNALDCYVAMTTHFDNVADRARAHWRVKGLERRKNTTTSVFGVQDIAQCIDYGLVRVATGEAVPKDAVRICRLLGLNKQILDNLPEE